MSTPTGDPESVTYHGFTERDLRNLGRKIVEVWDAHGEDDPIDGADFVDFVGRQINHRRRQSYLRGL